MTDPFTRTAIERAALRTARPDPRADHARPTPAPDRPVLRVAGCDAAADRPATCNAPRRPAAKPR